MGRAKGLTAAVSVAASVRRKGRAPSVAEAQARLLTLFGERRGQDRLARVDELHTRRLGDMLDSDMPVGWAFDTALADAAPTLRDRETEAALTDYLQARLRQDLPSLVATGLLEAGEAQAMSHPTRPDHYRAWAVLRAAHLMSESKRLREFANGRDAEYQQAALCVSERCEEAARADLADPPTEVCAHAAVGLALAHGLTRGLEQSQLYGGFIERHRQLIGASSGREVDAAVIAADFENMGAIRGEGATFKHTHGFCALGVNGGREVWLNPERLERELEHGQGYSLTLVHELIHSLQGDDPLKWSGTQTVAESELEDLLCEGATEGQTRMLLRGHATEFEEHIREDGMAFVLVLAEISAEGDEDQAMELVAKLAFCSNTERPQLAADLLCEGRVADLTEAAHEYATFAFDGSHPPAELMSRAGVLLRAVKAGPRLRADGAAELAFEAGLARLDASERV